ncbi:hypothetical protein AB0873_19135 [Micromonospora sp. NPDC047707]|uniref:hypothetical protein n=1 Tax=Micromonospora sp. NPDC047707 TaxID=3154498 RepID=UPI0034566ACB
MEYEQALTADKLWCWPVEVLDRLSELRHQAGLGHAAHRQVVLASHPLPWSRGGST